MVVATIENDQPMYKFKVLESEVNKFTYILVGVSANGKEQENIDRFIKSPLPHSFERCQL